MVIKRIFSRYFAPYAIAILFLGSIWQSHLAEALDLIIYDFITATRPNKKGSNLPITIISISEIDIQKYGWPIDDKYLCNAIDHLIKSNVSAIGFDLYRDRGVGMKQDCLRKRARSVTKLVSIFNEAEKIIALPGTPPERMAFNDIVLDPDGVVRRNLVHVGGQEPYMRSFPLRVVSISKGIADLGMDIERGSINLSWISPNSGGYKNIDSAGYQSLLDYAIPGSFQTYTLNQLLENNISREDLEGQIILLGSTAPSLRDQFEVPHTRFQTSKSQFLIPGVELHAHRIAQLLDFIDGDQSRIISALGALGNKVSLLLSAITALLIGESIPSLRRSILFGIIIFLGLLGLGLALLWMKFWIGIVMPLSVLLIFSSTGWFRRGVINQQQRKEIQKLLGQTTSPDVAAQLWEQREQLLSNGRFEGRQIPVTILFADTCNFTKVAESMNPSILMNWLNRGMSSFVPEITNNGGIVNKFTGDGFLAIFGAPVGHGPNQDAKAAIETAVSIQEALKKLNVELSKEKLPKFRLRIGIHSGEVLAGSIGSRERLEYGIIGDAVNCASRLESIEKNRQSNDCRVLVSSSTRELLQSESQFLWEEWGNHSIKGRYMQLKISELQGKIKSTNIIN